MLYLKPVKIPIKSEPFLERNHGVGGAEFKSYGGR